VSKAVTKRQLTKYKKMLEEKRAQLQREMQMTRGNLQARRGGDEMEAARAAFERIVAAQSLDSEHQMLSRVDGALREIEEGTFGICARCEGKIQRKRLEAVPWSPYCVACQRIVDTTGEEAA